MELEHCHHKCADTEFTTPNYNITTTSKSEYRIVAFEKECPVQHMRHGRNIRRINKLRALQIVMEANLSDEEIMAVVLYTGPMVITTIHHGIAMPCSCALHTCDVQSSHESKRAYVLDVYVHPTRIRRSLPASLLYSFLTFIIVHHHF